MFKIKKKIKKTMSRREEGREDYLPLLKNPRYQTTPSLASLKQMTLATL